MRSLLRSQNDLELKAYKFWGSQKEMVILFMGKQINRFVSERSASITVQTYNMA